jgi:hypothetical protein
MDVLNDSARTDTNSHSAPPNFLQSMPPLDSLDIRISGDLSTARIGMPRKRFAQLAQTGILTTLRFLFAKIRVSE